MQTTDILIVGGGLAGLTSAIHLSACGLSVTLIEKETYPHHKVCGEYISNEVLPYLTALKANPIHLNPAQITHLEFTSASGKQLNTGLPLGGFGLSRYYFDYFLYNKAISNGCIIMQQQVQEIQLCNDCFEVTTEETTYSAKVVLGAFGKRSALDIKLNRRFMQQKSPWLAVKEHFKGEHPEHVVGLHNFKGGYCGVSSVEQGVINICYLIQYNSFKEYKNIQEHREQVLYKNPVLKNIFKKTEPLFTKPLTISQVSFAPKKAVEEHILMVGDTAGLIHPLCGNGMAMAIHSAKIASELVLRFFHKEIDRTTMETLYQQAWENMFAERIQTGRKIAYLLQNHTLSGLLTSALTIFPVLLPVIIRKTHGKPIKMNPDVHEYQA